MFMASRCWSGMAHSIVILCGKAKNNQWTSPFKGIKHMSDVNSESEYSGLMVHHCSLGLAQAMLISLSH